SSKARAGTLPITRKRAPPLQHRAETVRRRLRLLRANRKPAKSRHPLPNPRPAKKTKLAFASSDAVLTSQRCVTAVSRLGAHRVASGASARIRMYGNEHSFTAP